MDDGDEPVTLGGLPLVTSAKRPSAEAFFTAYGSRVCLINGMEVRSVAHERCRRILMTGAGESGADDWGAILAAHGGAALSLPYLVVAGYSFSARYSDRVVRVGSANQLPELLSGSILPDGVELPSPSSADLADAWVRQRAEAAMAAAGAEQDAAFMSAYLDTLDASAALEAGAGGLSLETTTDGCSYDISGDASVVLDSMEQGLTRCGMVMSQGVCNIRWDQHSRLADQDRNYEHLFSHLLRLMEDIDSRPALAEDLVVVVLSEMGRHPLINAMLGRDHWTYTSAMILGSGVAGGRVIGGYNEHLIGRGVDLADGAPVEGGAALVPGHLGATLMALADIDHREYLPNHEPITAVLSSGG